MEMYSDCQKAPKIYKISLENFRRNELIELGFLKRYDSIKRLIDFGANGYFPLFEDIAMGSNFEEVRMTKAQRLKAKSLLKKISSHNNLEKQRVLFSTFDEIDQYIVARALVEMVEGKILDANPQLQ